MRRAAVLLMALFLVNLPFVHQTWTDHQLARSGRDVEATVIDARKAGGNFLVDYRLPRSVDPDRTRYSARVDQATFERAQESGALRVRVVPGKPANSRPDGAASSHFFAVVAALGDLALLTAGLFGYRRWRQRSQFVVVGVDGDDVTLDSRLGPLTATGPAGWAVRLRPGERISGGLHLITDHEVLPGREVGGFEQLRGSSYVVKGRVLDARAGRLVLELDDRSRLRVQTGPHRIRADIRDPTEVRGTLCFTPSRFGLTN